MRCSFVSWGSLALAFTSVACVSADATGPASDDAGLPFEDAAGFDSSFPDTSVSDASVRDTSVSDTSVADTSIADTSSADTSVADTSVADTSVDDASAADASLPETSTTDAAEPDAGDAAQPDAGPSGSVSVVVSTVFGPEAKVTVLVDDPSGNYVSTSTTDATGTATPTVNGGDQITVLLGSPNNALLVTVTGVQPGDTLAIPDWTSAAESETATVTLTGSPPGVDWVGAIGQTSLDLASASGSTTIAPPGSFTTTVAPLLVVATDDDDNEVAFATGTVPVFDDGGSPSVSVPDTAWATNEGTETVTFANVPTFDGGAFTLAYAEVAQGALASVQTAGGTLVVTDDGGVAGTQTWVTHPGYPDYVQNEVDVYPIALGNLPTNGGAGSYAVSALATRAPAAASGTASLDVSQVLPFVETATVAGTTVPPRPTLNWTSSAPLTSAVGLFGLMTWYEPIDGGPSKAGTWIILTPSTATSIEAPALPGSAAAWEPGGTSNFASLTAIGGSAIGSFDGLRAVAGQVSGAAAVGLDTTAIVPPIPAAGTMLVSTLGLFRPGGGGAARPVLPR